MYKYQKNNGLCKKNKQKQTNQEKQTPTNSGFTFSNLQCKKSHTYTRHPFPKLSNTFTKTHVSSFVRTGQLAYLCSVEGKPKIHQKFKFPK